MITIQEQLHQARRSRGLSQKAVGDSVGLPQSHISAIEAGKVDPRLSSITEMARVLNYEPVLVPKNLLPAIQAMISGQTEAPLWQIDENDKDET